MAIQTVGRFNYLRLVESLPDGGCMWIKWEHDFNRMEAVACYACSWDSALTISDGPDTIIPRVDRWFPNAAAARLAWECDKPKRPELKFKSTARYGVGFVNPRGIFGSIKS